ncbi:predicted protein [Histoplasma mississippiense (nom. inval.)]|uniref:predicted protein n=1 Tax=Ajellomyces capsulatus (strain NAm1 / WU24) TaxID=2059318 RepID=UPI000157B8E4|nr:predicted protein [Histoplasma mississippiense (nom. inval.)]EDN03542.1 predicted protein [Histoplasma mississippiense (nom. inval.)]
MPPVLFPVLLSDECQIPQQDIQQRSWGDVGVGWSWLSHVEARWKGFDVLQSLLHESAEST